MKNKKQTFGEGVVSFYANIIPAVKLPDGVELLLPFTGKEVMDIVGAFYSKFFNDSAERIYVFGINPGRFGGGVTGIPFTDPVRLREDCGIENDLSRRGELSAEYVYKMINAFGGAAEFYRHFFITAISPVGFMRGGINMNYYDDKTLEKAVTPYIIETMKQQLAIGARRDAAVCLGTGKNFTYFNKLNQENAFFKRIIPLEHPRFIMQYRRKRIEEYVNKYVSELRALI
jgi:hypothetical protein